MRIDFKHLKTLRVETASGAVLGRVRDLVLDTEAHTVAQYIVTSSPVISVHTYLIHPQQILKIDDEKMVVEDAAGKEDVKAAESPASVSSEPIIMRKPH